MPARFDPLGDDGIDARCGCRLCFLHRAHLQEDFGATAVRVRDIRRGVSPEEDHERHVLVETGFDLAFLEEGQEKVHPERFVGQGAYLLNLLTNVWGGQPSHAKHATGVGVRDRRDQLRPSHTPPHANGEEWICNTELMTERSL